PSLSAMPRWAKLVEPVWMALPEPRGKLSLAARDLRPSTLGGCAPGEPPCDSHDDKATSLGRRDSEDASTADASASDSCADGWRAAALPRPAELGWRLVVKNTFVECELLEESGMWLHAHHPAVPQPYLLTRDMFVELLNSHGFRGKFDLVYLPIDFKTNQALGYAFVNAIDPEAAISLFHVFEGIQAWPRKSSKTCAVCWGGRQGFESNVRVYRNLTVMKVAAPEAWEPATFSNGIQVPFPAPTRAIKKYWKRHLRTGSTTRLAA
ncbi:unnamed protein product, partial [Prorocentrum cordatum]